MSAKTVFLSYRHDVASNAYALLLKETLTHRGYDVFLDVVSIDAGKWADQILAQVPLRSHFILLLTPGALDRCVNQDDWVRREFEAALSSGRNIVPVREDSVDLTKLQEECPESMKGLFAFQIATVRHADFDQDIETLLARYIPPHKAPQPGDTAGVRLSVKATAFRADISRIDRYAPAQLIGREEELALLSDAWAKVRRADVPRPHVITLVALGGEGKTSVVAKWAAELAAENWPGCDAAFAWSFYSQGTREQMAASSDLFLKEALTFFGDPEMAGNAQGAFEKGRRLAQLVGKRRALLILDGVESLQYAPASQQPGELKDQGVSALLKGLAAINQGLCVVTTRYSVADLKNYWQTTAPETKLLRLSTEAGVALLKSLGVHGPSKDFKKLVEDVKGHALTLNLLGQFLSRAFKGDIRRRDEVKFEKADAKVQGGHAFRTIAAYEKWLTDGGDEGRREIAVLKLIGLFDRPADSGCLEALRREPLIPELTDLIIGLEEADWEFSITGLEAAKLLTLNRDGAGSLLSLDAHPLLREYFGQNLRTKHPDAWRAAHRRLYEHLCATTEDKDQPSLEDLQPLYQAVAHGCQAGMHQEACENVYYARILRGEEHYAGHKLGAYGTELEAQACFFEQPWSCLSSSLTDDYQAWLPLEAANSLRALGRLTEAIELMRAGLENRVSQEEWKQASFSAGNVSELELTLGEVSRAVKDAELCVIYAGRTGEAFERMVDLTVLADALHQAGRRAESEERFCEAEVEQADWQRHYPLLYSLQGFQYCDLLLAEPERAAWATTLECGNSLPLFTPGERSLGEARQVTPGAVGDNLPHSKALRAISQRAAQTLKWSEQSNFSLLTVALDHLTLGRTALYASALASDNSLLSLAKSHIAAAVDGLRHSGRSDHLPGGLLTSAWLRFLVGRCSGPESAQTDLDEAWEIAERGPMRLFMADIHLYRARLFHAVKPYPWATDADGHERGPKDDLAAARKLIEACGYWRRKEELEDAEAAAVNW